MILFQTRYLFIALIWTAALAIRHLGPSSTRINADNAISLQEQRQKNNASYETVTLDLSANVKIYAISAFEGKEGSNYRVPDYSAYYYYRYIEEKLLESLSVNNCTVWGSKRFASSPLTKSLAASTRDDADLIVEQVVPPDYVLANWGVDGMQKSKDYDLYVGISKNLSHRKGFRGIKRGSYLLAKGCSNLLRTNKDAETTKLLRNYHANFHPMHVRCNPFALIANFPADKSGEFLMANLPKVYQSLHTYPFIVKTKNAIVAKSGMFALKCGAFGLFSSCNAINWGLKAAIDTVAPDDVRLCSLASSSCPFRTYKKVFVVTQYDDTQIGQFLLESFPKLVMHLDFLYANPDVHIHYGFSKNRILPSYVLPHLYFKWLGLEHRLINGTIFANDASMPREGGCQDAGYNAWEIVSMRERFIKRLGLASDGESEFDSSLKPAIVIIERMPSSSFTQNKYDGSARRWPKDFLPLLEDGLKREFPGHSVLIFSDLNETLMTCPECQIRMFRQADMVISFHGAGMANTMYMRPGGVVVEVVSFYDSRHVPMTGIFPRLSGIIGLHHYTHYVSGTELVSKKQAADKPLIDPDELIHDIAKFRRNTIIPKVA